MIMHENPIEIKFKQRYALALLLIAFLSTGTLYIVDYALKASDFTALIVNKSAKQRMYSQRIASFSQQYYRCTYDKENCSQQATLQLNLEEAINEMRQANDALSSGTIKKDVQIQLSTTMREIYVGNTNLKQRVNDYLDLAEKLTKSQTRQEALEVLDHLLLLSNPLLVDLNAAVYQYQKEGEENISNIRYLESIAWLLTLFTLLIEVIFIFQPMANAIKLYIQNERSHNDRLEQEIKIRTYSLEQANQKLRHSASHDPLTGLNNRLILSKSLKTFYFTIKSTIFHMPF